MESESSSGFGLFNSESSSCKSSDKVPNADERYGESAIGLAGLVDGSYEGGGEWPKTRKFMFGLIIVFVMVLVAVLTLIVLEQTNVIVWDQTKPGVEAYQTWGQYTLLGGSVLAIGLLGWGRWKLGQKEKTE